MDDQDPRLTSAPGEMIEIPDTQPVVGKPPGGAGTAGVAALGLAFAAGGLFVNLNNHRHQLQTLPLTTPASAATLPAAMPAEPPPLRLPAPPAPPVPMAAAPPPAPAPAPVQAAPPPAPAPVVVPEDTQARLHAPAVVVDLDTGPSGGPLLLAQNVPVAGGAVVTSAPNPNASAAGGATPTGGAAAALAAASGNTDDQFAKRTEEAQPERAKAVQMHNLNALIPQGAVIPGMLETALNTDLPGYARAVVSRDVLSFDGRAVLIPRGSRLIGQYKSAVAQGASRAFVIWTRVIRPDGVSIQIGSPGTDELGRAGLDGQVDRHFFQRFGGSILLSVLNGGIAAVSREPTTSISIGSPGAAAGATSLVQGDAIPPTIKVAQGAQINIFVARDLDFSDVGPVKQP
jgi:type IV secretion system protein VirB10